MKTAFAIATIAATASAQLDMVLQDLDVTMDNYWNHEKDLLIEKILSAEVHFDTFDTETDSEIMENYEESIQNAWFEVRNELEFTLAGAYLDGVSSPILEIDPIVDPVVPIPEPTPVPTPITPPVEPEPTIEGAIDEALYPDSIYGHIATHHRKELHQGIPYQYVEKQPDHSHLRLGNAAFTTLNCNSSAINIENCSINGNPFANYKMTTVSSATYLSPLAQIGPIQRYITELDVNAIFAFGRSGDPLFMFDLDLEVSLRTLSDYERHRDDTSTYETVIGTTPFEYPHFEGIHFIDRVSSFDPTAQWNYRPGAEWTPVQIGKYTIPWEEFPDDELLVLQVQFRGANQANYYWSFQGITAGEFTLASGSNPL